MLSSWNERFVLFLNALNVWDYLKSPLANGCKFGLQCKQVIALNSFVMWM